MAWQSRNTGTFCTPANFIQAVCCWRGYTLQPRDAPRAAATWQGPQPPWTLLQKQSCTKCLSCHRPALNIKQGSMAPAFHPSSTGAFHYWSGTSIWDAGDPELQPKQGGSPEGKVCSLPSPLHILPHCPEIVLHFTDF